MPDTAGKMNRGTLATMIFTKYCCQLHRLVVSNITLVLNDTASISSRPNFNCRPIPTGMKIKQTTASSPAEQIHNLKVLLIARSVNCPILCQWLQRIAEDCIAGHFAHRQHKWSLSAWSQLLISMAILQSTPIIILFLDLLYRSNSRANCWLPRDHYFDDMKSGYSINRLEVAPKWAHLFWNSSDAWNCNLWPFVSINCHLIEYALLYLSKKLPNPRLRCSADFRCKMSSDRPEIVVVGRSTAHSHKSLSRIQEQQLPVENLCILCSEAISICDNSSCDSGLEMTRFTGNTADRNKNVGKETVGEGAAPVQVLWRGKQ